MSIFKPFGLNHHRSLTYAFDWRKMPLSHLCQVVSSLSGRKASLSIRTNYCGCFGVLFLAVCMHFARIIASVLYLFEGQTIILTKVS
jgi:hypothetical protein